MADVVENLNALHKEIFAEGGVPDLIPNSAKLQQMIKFEKKSELGLKYVQAVRLAYPGGFTHALGDGTAGAFSLNDAKSGTVKRAEVTAAQIVLKDQMDLETAFKASSSKKAFAEGSKFFYEGMSKAMRKRLETQLLYGAQGIGAVQTYTSGDPSIVISAATWASGIWAGLEGTELDVHSGSTSTVRGTVTIAGVDIDARKITLSGTVTGCTANDVVRFKGAYGNEMTGITGILSNSGSLFGIDASTYSLWKSTSYSAASAALSFNIVKKAVAAAVSKGLDEDAVLFVSPGAWDDLMGDMAATRRTDKGDVKKVDFGAEEIVFHSQNGQLKVIPSIFIKGGHAPGLVENSWKRLGAADVAYGIPGFSSEMFRLLDGKNGLEVRSYTHQCVYSEAPAKNFLITNIVNSA